MKSDSAVASGSPPRVWGKQRRRRVFIVGSRFTPTRVGKTERIDVNDKETRFTPTRVGKTRRQRLLRLRSAVHPHACGENQRLQPGRQVFAGSPPRVWGKRFSPGTKTSTTRFTPTRVGKTRTPHPDPPCWPVHPHACGENRDAWRAGYDAGGSPPRVWGKRARCRIVQRP